MQFTTIVLGVISSLAFAQSSYAAAVTATPTKVATHIGIQCTTVVTIANPAGCVLTAAAATTTELVDCQGCAMKTTLGANGFFGHGPMCFGGRQTTTDTQAVATVLACA